MTTHGMVFLRSEHYSGGAGLRQGCSHMGRAKEEQGYRQIGSHFLGQSHCHGERKRQLISPDLPTQHVFHQKLLEILVQQENKGSSLPWPPACSASRSCRRAWCSSCILERTKHRTVTLPGAGHAHPQLQADPFGPRHMEK